MLRTFAIFSLTAMLLAGCARHPGSPSPEPAATELAPPKDTLATLTTSDETTCLTTTAGAGYCWGATIGEPEGKPVRILDAAGAPARVRSLAPAFLGLCAVLVDGDVRCDPRATGGWTDSAGAEIPVPADCSEGGCVFPLPVRGALGSLRARAVTRGGNHGCVLTEGGAPFCWGSNSMGELGNGTWTPDGAGSSGAFTRAPGPVQGGLRFLQISTREWLTCGVATHDRGVYCWGYGQSGQAGDSTIMRGCHGEPPYANRACSTSVPTRVLPDSVPDRRQPDPSRVAFAQVSSGGRLACATDITGRAFCWGSNYRCELGQCRRGDSFRAWQVQLPGRAAEVHAGYWFACARTVDARIFCWGNNTQGQLGSLATGNAEADGGPPDYRDSTASNEAYGDACFQGGRCSGAAVEVEPGRKWYALAVGSNHACALAGDGRVRCWGGAGSALGTEPRIVTCDNRSQVWKDTRCQPAPAPVPGLPRLAPPPAPRPRAASSAEPDSFSAAGTRVYASRRELRIVFPRDTAREWGWSELQAPGYSPSYTWAVSIEGMDGTRTLSVESGRAYGDTSARRFGTLAELVAAARVALCQPGMMSDCSRAGLFASVQDQRVVLALRDSALIARLVGLRPGWVRVWDRRPDVPSAFRLDSVRVEYVDPQIAPPDSALRAEASDSRRRFEATVNTITRDINAPGSESGTVWMAVGDSVRFTARETRCRYDVCSSYQPLAGDSGWAVADSSILRLRPNAGGVRRFEGPSALVIARRVGRTTVRVRGLTGAGDTLPSSRPVPRELEVPVIVTLPVARVELAPRDTRAVAGQPVRFRTRALDTRGQVIDGAPVRVLVEGGPYGMIIWGSDLARFTFQAPGRHTVTASFGGRADTLIVDVAPAPVTAGTASLPAAPLSAVSGGEFRTPEERAAVAGPARARRQAFRARGVGVRPHPR